MHKSLLLLCFWITAGIIFILLSGQSQKNADKPGLPSALSYKLDSLRNADDLNTWLYTYRTYVYEDPSNRISILSKAQSTAWRNAKTDTEREEWFYCLAAQGYYLLYSGNILRSIDAYEQAYRFYFDKPIASVDVLEFVLKPLGNNYTRLGDYERAFFIQKKSLALAEENDSAQIASISHNLATTAIWKDELLSARQYCEKGLSKVIKNAALHGLLLSTLSEVLLKSGNPDAATLNSRSAIRILTTHLNNKDEPNVPYWLRGAWKGLGDIQKEKNDLRTALSSYQKAKNLLEENYKGQRIRERAQLSISSGQVMLRLNEPQNAIAAFNGALSLLMPSFQPIAIDELPDIKKLYGESTLVDALKGKADCLVALNKKESALQCYMILFAAERKLRREYFSNSAKEQHQKENRAWVEDALETAFQLWIEKGEKEYADQVLLIAEMSKAQLLLDEMMNNLRYNREKANDSLLNKEQQMIKTIAFYEKEAAMDAGSSKSDSTKNELQYELSLVQKRVKEKYPSRSNYPAAEQMPSSGSILQLVPGGTAVIEFFTGEKNIFIIRATSGKVEQIIKIENAPAVLKDISDFVKTNFQQGPEKMMNSPENYYKEAFLIYEKLQLGKMINNTRNCIIIPDGILGYLPFDALVTDSVYRPAISQWPCLVKKTNLYFSYSLQTAAQQIKPGSKANAFAGFFISFDSSSAAIPAVKKEYEEIHAVINGNYFLDKKATVNAFSDQLAAANVLHISTHSFLQGKDNMPVLQMAGDKFFLFELYGKVFKPQLVVLSACRTGHGMLAKGEGIISLARGFTATGASGIVAGLWDINDETTSVLMGMFYKHLQMEQRPANALHKAKLEWLQKKELQSFQQLPYFWAGMVYSGDNLPVNLPTKKTSGNLWWIALFVAAGILFIYFKRKVFN